MTYPYTSLISFPREILNANISKISYKAKEFSFKYEIKIRFNKFPKKKKPQKTSFLFRALLVFNRYVCSTH